MAYKEDVDSQLILTIGAISGFLVLVTTIGLQAWYLSEEQQETARKSAVVVNSQPADVREEQQRRISSYRWIDREKQVAAIPIDDAMKLLIENKGRLPTTQAR